MTYLLILFAFSHVFVLDYDLTREDCAAYQPAAPLYCVKDVAV